MDERKSTMHKVGSTQKKGFFTHRDLQIFEELVKGPLTTGDLAKKIGISLKSTWERVNYLESVGCCSRKHGRGRTLWVLPTIQTPLWVILFRALFSKQVVSFQIHENKIVIDVPGGIAKLSPESLEAFHKLSEGKLPDLRKDWESPKVPN
jgi:biotin operon repressor